MSWAKTTGMSGVLALLSAPAMVAVTGVDFADPQRDVVPSTLPSRESEQAPTQQTWTGGAGREPARWADQSLININE